MLRSLVCAMLVAGAAAEDPAFADTEEDEAPLITHRATAHSYCQTYLFFLSYLKTIFSLGSGVVSGRLVGVEKNVRGCGDMGPEAGWWE